MNEEYLRGLHTHLGIKDDYDTWINAVKDNEEYLKGLHGHLGIKDDYNTWYSAVLSDKKKDDTDSQSTGVQGDTTSSGDVENLPSRLQEAYNLDYPSNEEIYDLKKVIAEHKNLDRPQAWNNNKGAYYNTVQKATRLWNTVFEEFKNDTGNVSLDDYLEVERLHWLVNDFNEIEAYWDSEEGLERASRVIDNTKFEEDGTTVEGGALEYPKEGALLMELHGNPEITDERKTEILGELNDMGWQPDLRSDRQKFNESLLRYQDEAEYWERTFLSSEEKVIYDQKKREEQEKRKRRYGEETLSEYQQRIYEEDLKKAYENDDVYWKARAIHVGKRFEKSVFETQEEYDRRIRHLIYYTDSHEQNLQYREYQQKILEVKEGIDDGTIDSNAPEVIDFVRRTADEIGLNPETVTLETLSEAVNATKEKLEVDIFEKQLDYTLWDEYTKDQKDNHRMKWTYTRRATADKVMNLINQTGIYISDTFVGDPQTSELLQQYILARGLKTKIQLGHDPYDNRGISEIMDEEGVWSGRAWEEIFLGGADSFASIAASFANPYAGVAVAGAEGTLGTYEAYRDRGDLTEAEKQALAWGSGLIEGAITRIGMGNISRARVALGVVEETGKQATKQNVRKEIYKKAMEKLSPITQRVRQATSGAAARGITEYGKSILEEQAEELGINILQQGLAYAIADDEFDPHELADVAITTLGISGTSFSAVSGYSTYSKYRSFERTPTAENFEKYEGLKSYYQDLKKAYREKGISSQEKKVIRDEMLSVKNEMNEITLSSIETYENASETKAVPEEMLSDFLRITRNRNVSPTEQGFIQDINTAIRKISRTAKKSDSPTVKEVSKKKIQQLLEMKSKIEGGVSIDTQAQADPMAGGRTTQAPVTGAPEGVSFETAEQVTRRLAEKLEARKGKETAKETAGQSVNSRVRYLNPATNETVEGVLVKDGQRLAVETDEGNIIDIANFDEVSETKLPELNLSIAEGLLGVNEDGSFTYNRAGGVAPQGTKMVNKNGVKAIRRDKNGDIKNVLLTNEDGSETYNLKGEEAEEAAYQILLKETQTEADRAKVDEEFRLQAIEASRAAAETRAAEGVEETTTAQVEGEAVSETETAERAARREQRKQQIETVGDVNLTEENRSTVSNIVDALRIVAPDVKVVMHSSRDSYNKTHNNASRDVGHFNPNTNTIHMLVDGTNPLNTEGYLLLKHEAVHPILEAILASDPDFANRIENRIKGIMNRYAKGTEAQKRVLDHYERYARRSDQSLELLTEFVTVFSEPAGVKLLSRDKTAFEKISDLFQMIIDRIKGFRDAKVPSSEKEIVELIKAVGEAMKTGSAIDIDKTLTKAREGAIRSSLERSSDPSKAIQPKRGESPAEVKKAWEESKNNFIVAENFEHSLELRRMGFREAYQRGGKIYMSVPVKYESYNASSNVAKIKSDSFIKPSDVQDKSQKRVHDVLTSLAKFAGYKMEFVNRPDLNFDSAMVIPDRQNGLKENTVVVNLAYANARTGASGMSMVLVETLRRKAPDAFNELYKNIQQSGDSRVKKIFDSYLKNAPKEIKNKSDRELVAMANVIQELIDGVTTDAVGQSATDFINNFQEKLADALENQREGDLKLRMMPLGDNMILSIESALIKGKEGKGFKFDKEIEVKEKDIIQRLIDRVVYNLRRNNDAFNKAVHNILSPIDSRFDMDVQMGGLKKNTILDALVVAGYDADSDVLIDYLEGANVIEFLSTDEQLAEIGKVLGAMIEVNNSNLGFDRIEDVFTKAANVSSLNETEAVVHSFLEKFIGYMTSGEKSTFINPDGSFIDGLDRFVKDIYGGYNKGHVADMMYIITDNYDTARETKVHFDLMTQVKDIYYDGKTVPAERVAFDFEDIAFDTSLDIFEEVRNKAQRQQQVTPEAAEKVKEAKTLREAMELANLAVPNVTTDGVFVFKVGYDEMLAFFPKEFKRPTVKTKLPFKAKRTGINAVFNEDAFMEITVSPMPDGGINVSYDVAYNGKIEHSWSDFPSKWKVGGTTMPLVFKYANTVAALLNSKYLSFTAVQSSKHPEIDASEYSEAQIQSFITGEGDPVMRRGLNNAMAARNGHIIEARLGKDVAIVIGEEVYVTRDKDVVKWLTDVKNRMSPTIKKMSENDNTSIDIAEYIGEELQIQRPDLVDKLKSKGATDTKGRSILSVAFDVNENSHVLPQSEKISNNIPMQAAYENDQKYVSSSAIRPMLTPADKTGKKTLESVDKMFENAEEKVVKSGNKGILAIVKKYFSREALVVNSAKLQKAMEKGFADFIKAQFTALNGQRANADRIFQKIEKKIFGRLNTTQETILDKIIFLRRVIQIDSNWDNRLSDNKASLQAAQTELKGLQDLLKQADKNQKKRIQERIKNVKDKVKYFESQVNKYSTRPLHPTDGSQDVNLETATAALEQLKQDLGVEQFNNLSGRADMYFDEYRKILQQSYEAGLIDEATRDLFIKDEYQPRVFLEKMFGETPTAAFENMGLEADQIAGIKDGSTGEIFTDARYLLNLSLRSLKHKSASNELFAAMDEQAAQMQYKMKSDMVREANYRKDKQGNVIEDGFGNKAVDNADEGYKNVYYREGGKKKAFQIKSEYWNHLHGIEERSLLTPTQKRRVAKYSGTTAKKALVTGLRPSFALIATSRGFVEVTRGRGTYDQFRVLPAMQVMAMIDFMRSLPDAVMDGKVTEDYFAHGGGMSFLTNQGRPEQIYKKKRSTVRRLLGKYSPFKGAAKVLGFAGEKAEIALRLAIYQRTLNNLRKNRPELTETQRKYLAVEDARMIADFSQGGWLTKDLDSIKPYINAAVQGTRGTLEYARKNPKMFVAKQIQAYMMNAALTLMGMMFLGKDEWDKIPAYIKNRYTLIPTFLKGEDYDGNERPLMIRIPKAHQFMFFDRLAGMTGEYLYHLMNDLDYDFELYTKEGYLGDQGFELADALLGSLPAGDLIPEEVFTPKKLSVGDFFMQIVSAVPLGGALDAYGNNIDRYREREITYDYGKVDPTMEGYKDGKTRDMFKLFSKITGESAPRSQAAFEKLFAGETSQIVSFIYQMTDMMIVTDEEKQGAQLNEDKKKEFDRTFGIKKSFQYIVPNEKRDINRDKIFKDLDTKEENEKKRIREEIKIMLKNEGFDYKTATALPKDVQGFIKELDPAYRRYAAGYAKNRAKGMETDNFFFDVAYSEPVAAAAKLRLEYEFEKWDELPKDVQEDIKLGLFEAGLKNTRGLMQELK